MSVYLADSADLTSVANAIRTKGGTSAQLAFPADFVSAIGAIETGGGTPDNIRVILKNERASGSIIFTYPQYNATVGAVVTSSSTVAVGNKANPNVYDLNGVIGFNINYAVSQILYDGTELPFSITGSGSNRKLSVTLPSNFDETIPLEFS